MGGTGTARVAGLRARAGELLTRLGLAEMPDTPQVFPQPPHDWLVLRLSEDPAYHIGELAIPPAHRRVLRELDRRIVVFDELFIAHEIAKAGLHGSLKPSAKEISEPLSPPSAETPRTPALTPLSVLTRAFIVGGKLLCAAAVSPLLAPAADPVLIGAVIASGQSARPWRRSSRLSAGT